MVPTPYRNSVRRQGERMLQASDISSKASAATYLYYDIAIISTLIHEG